MKGKDQQTSSDKNYHKVKTEMKEQKDSSGDHFSINLWFPSDIQPVVEKVIEITWIS